MSHAPISLGSARLSVPPAFATPRPLTDDEMQTLHAVADVLVPAAGENPAATEETGFDSALRRAADARADVFNHITSLLAQLKDLERQSLELELRRLYAEEPDVFQPLSAIVAEAWLLVPAVRARIGYPGQHHDPPDIDQVVDELSEGILQPVIDRGSIYTPAPD